MRLGDPLVWQMYPSTFPISRRMTGWLRHTGEVSDLTSAPDSDHDSVDEPSPLEGALAVVLAAGAGSRFAGDEHKLLAKLEGKPLIWWATTHALNAGFDEVLVVEGAVELAEFVPEQASIVRNHEWADGQSRSLHVAVRYASMYGYTSVVIGLGDQPFVPPEAWRLIAAAKSPIAVADFGHDQTPPVRLSADVWDLLPLDGDEGARQLMASRPEMVSRVACPGKAVDVDTLNTLDRVRRDPMRKELQTWT